MSTLTLNDGTVLPVLETSTTSAITVEGDIDAISTAIGAISTENLKNADLAGTTLTNKILSGFGGNREDAVYTVTFNLRDKTQDEIQNEQIEEVQNALMDIVEI